MNIIKDLISGGLSGIGNSIKGIIQQVAENKLGAAEANQAVIVELNRASEAINDAILKEKELENNDRANARQREADVIKQTGQFDYMMWLLAGAGIGLLVYILYTLTTKTIPVENREMVASTKGTVEMIVVGIFSYYFGSSVGSRIKDMKR